MTQDSPTKPRLKDRFANICRTRHLSLSTERGYWAWVCRFVKYHSIQQEIELVTLPEQKFSDFISSIAPKVSVNSRLQCESALRLFYLSFDVKIRVSRSKKAGKQARDLPKNHTHAQAIIGELRGKSRQAIELIYNEGISPKQAARKLKMSPVNIQQQTRAALKRLSSTKKITPLSFKDVSFYRTQKQKFDDWYSFG